jgi:hypothetical protein
LGKLQRQGESGSNQGLPLRPQAGIPFSVNSTFQCD